MNPGLRSYQERSSRWSLNGITPPWNPCLIFQPHGRNRRKRNIFPDGWCAGVGIQLPLDSSSNFHLWRPTPLHVRFFDWGFSMVKIFYKANKWSVQIVCHGFFMLLSGSSRFVGCKPRSTCWSFHNWIIRDGGNPCMLETVRRQTVLFLFQRS